MTGAALVVQGDAGRLPLLDASVDLVVTSPPYLWKRKYAIAGTGELGNERNWREYLDNLWTVTDEMLRVLKPKGSIFVNLGDTRVAGREPKWLGIPPKSRLLLPERYRVGCQDRYASRGVIVRQVQIWEKANGLPESTVDRTRDSHEDWVHLTKQPRYYSAVDEIREPHTEHTLRYYGPGNDSQPRPWGPGSATAGRERGARDTFTQVNPLGKLPGSVWTIPSEPLRLPDHLGVQHYAAFPSEWPRRLILGWSPPGICLECGAGRVPVVERPPMGGFVPDPSDKTAGASASGPEHNRRYREHLASGATATILGYACSCTPFTDHPDKTRGSWTQGRGRTDGKRNHPERDENGNRPSGPRPSPREYHLDGWKPPPTRPAIVADVFGGTGTTAMVARALGRIGVSIDLSHSYSRAARWRAHHDAGKAISRTWVERQGSLL
jgi:hypothetical protein